MKFKLSHLVFVSLISVSGVQVADAGPGNSADIFQNIKLDGLSLKSTASDIEAFIASNPSLNCQRVDAPETKRAFSKRPPKPRQQSWTCQYSDKTTAKFLVVHMSGGVITHLHYDTRRPDPEFFAKSRAYIAGINKQFEAAGLVSDQTNSKNFKTYKEQDIKGGSSPVFHQQLNATIAATCDGTPIFFRAVLSANKTPSQNIYGVGFKIERNTHPINCAVIK